MTDRGVHLHLELHHRGETLAGCVTLDGAPPRRFTGWIGLNGAIDEMLRLAECTDRAPAATDSTRRATNEAPGASPRGSSGR